jgi:hypothetical protein
MKSLYLQLDQNESLSPSQAAMFLAMFSISAFFYHPCPDSHIAPTQQEAVNLSKFWARCALEVLGSRTTDATRSLDSIQAYILLSYTTFHVDGFSARSRQLHINALSIARELMMHRLDGSSDVPSIHQTPRELIQMEVKRRVFWHLVATDWYVYFVSGHTRQQLIIPRLYSNISGPQEGSYLIHPNHISVQYPRDCNDDDLLLGTTSDSTDQSQPTSMSFILARLRLAHLCREITDFVPLNTSQLMKLPYDQIIALDKKMRDFLTNLPVFFRLDTESRAKSKSLEGVYFKIPIMRYCITVAAHVRRCRLHQRFLLRQASDPRHTYSRQACLESARVIVQSYADTRSRHDSPADATTRMAMALHYTHIALVVMAMDLCFNSHEIDNSVRKEEVQAALRMLDEDAGASTIISQLLNSLRQVLHRHNINLPVPEVTHDSNKNLDSSASTISDSTQLQFGIPENAFYSAHDSFNGFLELAMQTDATSDATIWDNVFSSMDTRPF